MTSTACAAPIEFARLVDYWLGEVDPELELWMDEHLLECGHCSEQLAGLAALADGIRAAFKNGEVRAFLSDAFVKHFTDLGMRVREYEVPRDSSVNCMVAPDDEVLVARLQAPLTDVARLDAEFLIDGAVADQFRDIPFNPTSGEVVIAPKIASFRKLPSGQHRLRLIAVEGIGRRVIGEYTFNHSPHADK